MRYFFSICCLLFLSEISAQDAEVYNIVQDPARLMICEMEPISNRDKKKCSEQRLLRYVTQKITYPEQAIADSIEGTVVVRFVVTDKGLVGDAEVLKDIGGGCGDAALAIIDSIRADSIEWRPGIRDSVFVNSYVTLPIRFNIPKIYDYRVIDGDTIYTTLDTVASYPGGELAFNMYVQQNLGYPRSGIDSCRIGDFGAELLILPEGKAKILDLIDYNRLGIDFEFQAIRLVNAMPNNWKAAVRKEKKVPALYTTRILFQPPSTTCAQAITDYDKAYDLNLAGDKLYEEEDFIGAAEKYSAAIELVPGNMEYRYKRGLTYFELEKNEEACADIMEAKKHLLYTSIDPLLPLLCK